MAGGTNTSYNTGQQVKALDYAPDDSYYAHGGDSNDLFIYDGNYSSMSSKLFTFTQAGNDVKSVRFTKASDYLASACKDNKVYIYKRRCTCPAEYYWNSSFVCRFCALDMVGCRLCNTSSVCLLCTDHYYLASSNLCATCVSAMTACEMCTSISVCTQCSLTYYVDATNKCSLCMKTLDGCI